MIDLYNEDCFERIKGLADNSVDLVVTDPPYWHKDNKPRNSAGHRSVFAKSDLYNRVTSDMVNDMGGFKEDSIFALLDLLSAKMKKVNAYFFCSENQIVSYGKYAEENGLFFNLITWRKPLSIINKDRFSMNAEYVCRVYEQGTKLNHLSKNEYYDRVMNDETVRMNKVHPTQKPVSAFERFISLSSNEGDLILDPFMGSGTCGIACRNLKRNFIGVEKEKEYFDIAKTRIEVEGGVSKMEMLI